MTTKHQQKSDLRPSAHKGYSHQLEMEYIFDGEMAVFEDDVIYSLKEMLFLASVPNSDIVEIHTIKKLFDGELIIDE